MNRMLLVLSVLLFCFAGNLYSDELSDEKPVDDDFGWKISISLPVSVEYRGENMDKKVELLFPEGIKPLRFSISTLFSDVPFGFGVGCRVVTGKNGDFTSTLGGIDAFLLFSLSDENYPSGVYIRGGVFSGSLDVIYRGYSKYSESFSVSGTEMAIGYDFPFHIGLELFSNTLEMEDIKGIDLSTSGATLRFWF